MFLACLKIGASRQWRVCLRFLQTGSGTIHRNWSHQSPSCPEASGQTRQSPDHSLLRTVLFLLKLSCKALFLTQNRSTSLSFNLFNLGRPLPHASHALDNLLNGHFMTTHCIFKWNLNCQKSCFKLRLRFFRLHPMGQHKTRFIPKIFSFAFNA